MGRRVRPCMVRGPLGPWAAGFESWLLARGYSPWTVRYRVCMLADLSRWLAREGSGAGDLTAERAELFVGERHEAGYSTWVSSTCVALPLAYLREVRAVPAPVTVTAPQGRWVEVLAGYHEYLVRERGLAPLTVAGYERVARLFLEQLSGDRELELLTAAEVSGFLARECPRRSVSGARDLVACLRPLLRYLHVAGLISSPLVWAVPGVADLRDRSLPRGLEPEVVARLLAGCDRRRTVGRRDYAILLLLVRLGLRAGEVAAMQLEDLDWRAGEILVRGKGDRLDRLPLPVDVGEALVSYLRRRGSSEFRTVFLKAKAPAGAMSRGAVCGVVHDACGRAGVPPVGAHRLRDTAATAMLREGASLVEIAQVLRHREIKTTAAYAKVDRTRLRELAMPWPGGAS
jgi:integrase/recombinase XerD